MKGENMEWKFENDRPIYIQLVEQLKLAIASGVYSSGERLPSVRDLALEIKANPNTVQRAYSELEDKGLVYTQRTNGKFVTENQELLKEMREKIAKEEFLRYIENMKKLGYTAKEIKEYIQKNEKEIGKENG